MPEASMSVDIQAEITPKILAHYDANARSLPWRSPPGTISPPPYRVWLSEIMLQQTTVAAVKPYFEAFTARWPDVAALASADDADVMSAWAGLGYYARARNLLACARTVVAEHGGKFPETEAALLTLPGIGAYTAAAIAAIAFGRRAVVVDGNVERVVARLFRVATPMPVAKPELRAFAAGLTPQARCGDFAQAMMDLGATVCTPRNPGCERCPVNDYCAAQADPEGFPVKAVKAARPARGWTAWWIEQDGSVMLVRRPPKGLLGGMRALPVADMPPVSGDWRDAGQITHIFTHFALTLSIKAATLEKSCALQPEWEWWPIVNLGDAGLPSLFAKAARAALKGRDDAKSDY
jgi:A/G-specific adenine glycosylase